MAQFDIDLIGWGCIPSDCAVRFILGQDNLHPFLHFTHVRDASFTGKSFHRHEDVLSFGLI